MSAPLVQVVPRRLEPILDQLVGEEPVIALHGPRSVGKSTLLRALAKARGVAVVDLDEPSVREAATANPRLAVGGPGLACIDEYQHVPLLLDALKARLNVNGSAPGTAVLTGSTRQDAIPRTAQALTGRLHLMTIWPLSQGEIGGVREDMVEALRDDPAALVGRHPRSDTRRSDYVARICAGGMPLALQRPGPSRDRWFDGYVTQSVERDAAELGQIHQRQLLRSLLGWLAGRTGQLAMISKVADVLGGNRTTLESYTRLLEDLFLVERLPAWGKTLRARTVATPKVHVIDSGVAARLLRLTPAKLSTLDATARSEFGSLLETFVVGELRKQISWLDEQVTVGHWRTHDGDEVDFVIEFDDGRVLGFEVKSAERVSGDDFRGLRKMRDALGERFIAGVTLNLGLWSYPYEDRLHVMPVDRLWSPSS
ncbi:ATP-binding protein [uncultured Friedmanniella sp.]|uniref:ATP-binding protein n=1 Tax=uncultured Friedmanniella sp. TaxID=335381 RepID=UPI0035CA9899